jgi:ABC-type bacteriocin/lantibiotic exporter with double-glycine peptidase domain
LLILDEATSELDSQSEAIIKSAIEQIAGEVTILIVAHRSSIVMNSDITYVIENGSIADLMAANGPFNNMSNE